MGFNEMIEQIQKQWGGPWAIQNFAPSRENDENFRAWWAKILRSSSSPSSVRATLESVRDIDIRLLLPQVRTRTLVLHKKYDRLNIEAGRYFATHMPNAQWVELPGADHIYFIESEGLISAIAEFVPETPEKQADTWIGIVLYARIPNAGKHEALVRSELTAYHAKGLFFTDNECIASFDSPSRAIQCALNLGGGSRMMMRSRSVCTSGNATS